MTSELTVKNEDKFINAINFAIPELRPTKMTKIKNYEHQVVIEADDFYYKVYEDKKDIGVYRLEIRKKLAKIYESYGIHWVILSFEKDGMIYTVEQREKLPVCGNEISCKDLLIGWKKTLDLLEKDLRFEYMTLQIKEEYPELEKLKSIKLIRECINKPNDYAYGHNGEIILLDDADWFLTFIDEKGERIYCRDFKLDVMTTVGELTLALNVKELTDRFIHKDENTANYFLFKYSQDEKNAVHKLINYRDKMLDDNTKLLAGIDLPEQLFKYQEEYVNEFKLKYDDTKLLEEGESNG